MNRPQPSRHERLQVMFTFLVLFGGVMFLIRPDPRARRSSSGSP